MNREEAQVILVRYRPGIDSANAPEIAEALRVAEGDPELGKWLAEQTAFHANVRSGLRGLAAPQDLRTIILRQSRVIVPVWRKPLVLLAAAACLAALLGFAFFFATGSHEDLTFAGFRSRMVGFALRQYSMDIVTNDLQQVRIFHRQRGTPSDFNLTERLSATPVKGGAALSWQNHPVSMICFDLENRDTAYMFVTQANSFSTGLQIPTKPTVQPLKGIFTASWTEGNLVYLLAAHDATTLQQLITAGKSRAQGLHNHGKFSITAG